MMPGDGAVAMQAAPEEARDRAAARLVCGKAGLEEGTPLFERCVSAYRDRQRVLSRAEARQRRTRALRVRQLCLEPGEFILVQCLEI